MGTQLYFAAVPLLVLFMTLPSPPLVNAVSLDQMIIGAQGEKDVMENTEVMSDLNAAEFRQELDMILTKQQYMARNKVVGTNPNDPSNKLTRKKRKAIKDLGYRWTDNVIPYNINPGIFTAEQSNLIIAAQNEWERYTCLTFRQKTSSDRNYVYFDTGSGCSSYVGMTGGGQKISLSEGCRHHGVIVHEIGHAVGFHHEQNRPDRDDHVRIIEENIPENILYNFKKYPWDYVGTHNVPYDYKSVMHYGKRAFSINGRLTIETLDPAYQEVIGNREGLSFNDIWLANAMYTCDEKCTGSSRCPQNSYRGKDCKCYCPGSPVRECDNTGGTVTTKSPVTQSTSKPVDCEDLNQWCSDWADAGYCRRSTYVATYCKRSCGSCETVTKPPICDNKNDHCEYWKGEGYCTHDLYGQYMADFCPRSCNKCPANSVRENGNDARLIHCNASTVILTTLLTVFTYMFKM